MVKMARLSLISAIIIIMAFTPLGYLRTPFLSITLLTIPVTVGTVLLGPAAGAFCGGIFGITSVVNAVTTGGLTGMLLQINPAGALFTLIVPRILDGFVTGLIFAGLKKTKYKRLPYFAASLACPVLNTVFFISSLLLIFYRTDYIQNLASGFGTVSPFTFIAAFVGVQGIIEAVLCFIAASAINLALSKAIKS